MEDNPWSIMPIDGCARVDNNGLVTFEECAIGKTYTVIYNNGMCESKTYIIVKKEELEPTGCAAFIVDGGSWGDVPQTGDSTCDSAFLYHEGRPIFEPLSADSWVRIKFYHWDEEPSEMCSNYRDYPCVAANFFYEAGIIDTEYKCPSLPLDQYPQVVQDAVNKTGKYANALGTIKYFIAANNEGHDRTCTIRWIVDSEECPSRDFTITQLGGSIPPTPTCTCHELIVSGKTISYEAKENIQIGSYSVNCITNISATSSLEWVTILSVNNGKIFAKVTENESTESARTANITVTGKAGSNTCTKTFTLIQNKKVTACTTCDDANIQGLSGGATAEGGTNILIGSFSYSCDPGLTAKRVSGGDFITNMTVSNGNVYGTVSPNTADTSRTEDIGIYVGDEMCAQYTLTQQGATPSTCTCQEANVQIGTTAITLGNAAYSTANTTYSHDCTVYINNNEAEGWLDVNSTNGKLEFNSISQTTSVRSANVYIDDIDGRHCETIKVTQEGLVHTYSFKFKYYDYEEGPMVTGDYNRYTSYEMTDFEIDGQPATMQVEVYYRRSFYDKSVQDCTPTSAQNYTGGTSDSSVQTYDEGTQWCGGALIHVTGFMVKYNGIILKQVQGHDNELDGTYEGEFS